MQDKHGNLWCSTIQGICHILVDGKQVINYYTGNGLQEKVYLEGRYTQSKKEKFISEEIGELLALILMIFS